MSVGKRQERKKMEEKTHNQKELTLFQATQVKWLKQQVRNLQDEKRSLNPRPRIDQEIFAADMELTEYQKRLRENGYKV
jgi:hypothetical protein